MEGCLRLQVNILFSELMCSRQEKWMSSAVILLGFASRKYKWWTSNRIVCKCWNQRQPAKAPLMWASELGPWSYVSLMNHTFTYLTCEWCFAVISTVPHSKKFLGSIPGQGLSVWSLRVVSPLQILRFPSSHSPKTCVLVNWVTWEF